MVDSFVDLKGGGESWGRTGQRALSLAEAPNHLRSGCLEKASGKCGVPTGSHELIAVHADRRESDLRLFPKDTLALWQSTGKAGTAAGGAPGEPGEKPYSIWWYVLFALLVAAMVESIFAGKYLNPEQAQPIARKQAA